MPSPVAPGWQRAVRDGTLPCDPRVLAKEIVCAVSHGTAMLCRVSGGCQAKGDARVYDLFVRELRATASPGYAVVVETERREAR